jgi:erythromycin esterase
MCLLIAVTAASSASAQAVPDSAAVTQWLNKNAIRLSSVEAGHGFADLDRLAPALAGVRIVGLGEATHGTRQFFQMKHRMLEFLVKRMGFTVFAIEASYPAANTVNEYVLEGRGDRAKVLAGLGFWTWDTEEVSAMIDWMRRYNETAPGGHKVQFLGYDMQAMEKSYKVIDDYLDRVSPSYRPTADAALASIHVDRSVLSALPLDSVERRLAGMYQFIGYLEFNRPRFVQATSDSAFATALLHARVLVQGAFIDQPNSAGRDYYMAENIHSLLDAQPAGTKMVVWAHNGHIKADSVAGYVTMGNYLRHWYGPKYFPLGFTFGNGGFQSRDLRQTPPHLAAFTAGAPPPGTIDWYFSQPGISPGYVTTFRAAPQSGPVRKWLDTSHDMRSVGSGFNADSGFKSQDFMEQVTLAKAYDGIIYVAHTSRARPTPTGVR